MIKIEILSVRDPQWADEKRSAINCYVRTNTFEQEMPFTAAPDDPELHGREVFRRCRIGEFGEVADPEQRQLPEPSPPAEVPVHLKRLEKFLSYTNLENTRKSFRSVIIIWASFLDALLDELLEAEALRVSSAGDTVSKPPRTFNGRINHAFAAGIIDQEEENRCHIIRRIRNAAAHDWELTLETKGIRSGLLALYEADHSGMLIFHEDLDYLIQQVYSPSCATFIIQLLNRL
nr:DUF4145 domain-containing protein [Aeromonas cavernicola]